MPWVPMHALSPNCDVRYEPPPWPPCPTYIYLFFRAGEPEPESELVEVGCFWLLGAGAGVA